MIKNKTLLDKSRSKALMYIFCKHIHIDISALIKVFDQNKIIDRRISIKWT